MKFILKRFIFGDKIEIKNGKMIEDKNGSNAIIYLKIDNEYKSFEVINNRKLIEWLKPTEDFEDFWWFENRMFTVDNFKFTKENIKDLNTIINVEVEKHKGYLGDELRIYYYYENEKICFNEPTSRCSITNLYGIMDNLLKECYLRTGISLISEFKKIDEKNYYDIINYSDNNAIVSTITQETYDIIIEGKEIKPFNYATVSEYIETIIESFCNYANKFKGKSITLGEIYSKLLTQYYMRSTGRIDFSDFIFKKAIYLSHKATRNKNKLIINEEDIIGVLLIGSEYKVWGIGICGNGVSYEKTFVLLSKEEFDKIKQYVPIKNHIQIKSSDFDKDNSNYELVMGEDMILGYKNHNNDFISLYKEKDICTFVGLNPNIIDIELLSVLNKDFKEDILVESLVEDKEIVGYSFTIGNEKFGITKKICDKYKENIKTKNSIKGLYNRHKQFEIYKSNYRISNITSREICKAILNRI